MPQALPCRKVVNRGPTFPSIRLRAFPSNRSPFSDLPSSIRVLFVSRCLIPTLSIAIRQVVCELEPVYSTRLIAS